MKNTTFPQVMNECFGKCGLWTTCIGISCGNVKMQILGPQPDS